MAQEIQAGALDGVQDVFGRRPEHTLPIGAPCPNCATALAGPWCHACGQSSEDFHRSLARLAAEAFGGLVDLDSRLWQTMPGLFFNPARLTRDYLAGHRAPQAPPFRMFLIVVVALFLVAGLRSGPPMSVDLTGGGAHIILPGVFFVDVRSTSGDALGQWLAPRLALASKHPQVFEADIASWAEHLAILALPVSALLLGLMFFWRRGVYMFDHLIFSMHSLTFQGLLAATVMLGQTLSGWFGLLLLAAPAHLFLHLKGAYGLGTLGTLARMLGLFLGSVAGFVAILLGVLLIGLAEMTG